MRNSVPLFILLHTALAGFGQVTTNITVDASTSIGTIEPLWGDHYEMHLLFGWGGNPYFIGAHQQFIDDTTFQTEIQKLRPRYIRVSTGRFENPHDSTYFSTHRPTLKNLWTEFYKGPLSLAGAYNLSHYDFSYVDSLTDVVSAMGAEPFFDLAYMPFVLSSDTIPDYHASVPLTHLYSWDNSIRNSPPSDVAVYARVMYQLIKHLNQQKGVQYFELWNEPDQFPLNTFFWKGTATQLYDMYAGIVAEISGDTTLANNLKMGCCGFALNSAGNLFPLSFLSKIQQNNTRLDFISFHPYSSSEMGGYDSARVNTVTGWRNTYAPNAELINSEWGILSSGFGSAGWSDLDYGLDKTKAIIHMNSKGIEMAHQAALADITTTATSCCIGQFYVDPIFSPKPSAYVNYNLNKLLNTPLKILANSQNDAFVLAGKSISGDTIVVAFPAGNPIGTDLITLSIDNIPWTEGKINRFELTETSYSNNQVFNLVFTASIISSSVTDTVQYQSDGGSGRLVIWELIKNGANSIKENSFIADFQVFPNPSAGRFTIKFPERFGNRTVVITDAFGRMIKTIVTNEHKEQVDITISSPGLYFVNLLGDNSNLTRKITINR